MDTSFQLWPSCVLNSRPRFCLYLHMLVWFYRLSTSVYLLDSGHSMTWGKLTGSIWNKRSINPNQKSVPWIPQMLRFRHLLLLPLPFALLLLLLLPPALLLQYLALFPDGFLLSLVLANGVPRLPVAAKHMDLRVKPTWVWGLALPLIAVWPWKN